MPQHDHATGNGEAEGRHGEVELQVRQGLRDIRDAIDRLERTCRQGRITPGELAEERDLLQAQQYGLQSRR
jgi:hypothetical protein